MISDIPPDGYYKIEDGCYTLLSPDVLDREIKGLDPAPPAPPRKSVRYCGHEVEVGKPCPECSPAPPKEAREQGWLIERGGLCFGFRNHTWAWVAFTDDSALRLARRSDAIRFIEAFRDAFGLQDVLVTEHIWGM